MNVMEVARTIGLAPRNGEVSGTIEENKVVTALERLAQREPEYGDLCEVAADRVRSARSAGVEQYHDGGRLISPDAGEAVQLRYRSEVADIFTDLAIDVGLRRSSMLAELVN